MSTLGHGVCRKTQKQGNNTYKRLFTSYFGGFDIRCKGVCVYVWSYPMTTCVEYTHIVWIWSMCDAETHIQRNPTSKEVQIVVSYLENHSRQERIQEPVRDGWGGQIGSFEGNIDQNKWCPPIS